MLRLARTSTAPASPSARPRRHRATMRPRTHPAGTSPEGAPARDPRHSGVPRRGAATTTSRGAMVVPPIRSPAVRLDVVARPGQERAEAGHDQARPRYFASKLPVHGNGFCSDECHLSLTVVLFMSKIVAQHAEGIHHSWNFGLKRPPSIQHPHTYD